jgi:hypothetical protein
MSSPKKVFVIISDPNINLSMFLINSSYTFPNIEMTAADYKLGYTDDIAAYNAAIRLVRERFNSNIERNRLHDISLQDDKGEKIYVFLCKLNNTEIHELSKFLVVNPMPTFFNINNLPKNLDIVSSAIAYAITRNINLIKDAKPKSIILNLPDYFIHFKPLYPVPILMPFGYVSFTKVPSPKKSESDIKIEIVPRKPSPKKLSPKKLSPKKPSPKIIRKKISPIVRNNSINTDTSSIESTSPTKSKKKGGYYSKYLKYKIKFLESEKHILLLEEKINKYNSI